ncbi:MAG: undecaprenyl-diphosphate phosphatase [Alphaproteobacteria bacterium]|nr:undecaprenyl-diphosphate phosphatase [Alphaproteobacteria bacterium]
MLHIFILSLIQGLTEFLPVSSSGHLILAEEAGITAQGLVSDIALHVGTLFAVCLYFGRDLWDIKKRLFKTRRLGDLEINLIVATIPAVAVGFFVRDIVETALRSPIVIAAAAIVFGILLWLADKTSRSSKHMTQMRVWDAFCIGCAQCLAFIPGVSRSGITMTCARWLGVKRSDSARFSMLLSVPTIFLGAAWVFYQAVRDAAPIVWPELAAGIVFSAVFGWLAIGFLMRWVQHASFGVFAIYRIALGLVLLYYFL